MDLKLKYKVKASNIHGVPLATDNTSVVRHRLYTPTLNSTTFQHSIANDSATLQCYRNLSTRSGNIREPIPQLSEHSSASHSAISDRFRRLYRNLSYATLRIHANACRTVPMAKLCPFIDTERFTKIAQCYRQPFCKVLEL